VNWHSYEVAASSAADGGKATAASLADLEAKALTAYKNAMLAPPGRPNAPLGPQLLSLYAPDAHLLIPGVADAKGAAAIADAYQQAFGGLYPRSTFAPSRVFRVGDEVAFTWDLRAGLCACDGAGSFMGVGPMKDSAFTGVGGITILWFNPDGTIREDHTYVDVDLMLEQLTGIPDNVTQGVFGDPEQHVAHGTPDESLNADIPKRAGDALVRKAVADFLGFFTSDVVTERSTGRSEGADALKDGFEKLVKGFPDLTQKNEGFGVEDYVVNELTTTGTQTGPYDDFPVTKKPATWHGAEVLQMKGGKIAHQWIYVNRRELRAELGLLESKPAAATKAPAQGANKTPR
jgi:hypothetical protein